MLRGIPVLVLVIVFSTTQSLAEVIPGRWEKVDQLASGTGVVVTLRSGDRIPCLITSTTGEVLMVKTEDGTTLSLEKSAISTVEGTQRIADSNVDGTLIGTAIGFGAAFGICAAANAKATASGPIWEDEAVALYSSCGILGAGAGALTGYFLDHAQRKPEVYYKAIR